VFIVLILCHSLKQIKQMAQKTCPADGDVVKGEALFKARCTQCHTVAKGGANKTGPNLYGLIGRHTGSVPNYQYTKANKEANVVWTPDSLFNYLENPKKFIPGTKMAFAGLKSEKERADLVAYLVKASSA